MRRVFPGVALLLACGGPELEPTLCESAAFLTITAAEQSTIDELTGCEEMYNLEIIAPLDLRPLTSSRRLGGLYLRDVAALEGLENLEQTDSLALNSAALRSLRPLSALRYI